VLLVILAPLEVLWGLTKVSNQVVPPGLVGPEDLMHLLDPNLLAQLDLQGLVDL
jgi:hypothetical protein